MTEEEVTTDDLLSRIRDLERAVEQLEENGNVPAHVSDRVRGRNRA